MKNRAAPPLGERAQLAWDAVEMRPTRGIPTNSIHVMDVPLIEQVTGHGPGDYARDPDGVYVEFQRLAGACFLDQYLADNPLTMGPRGYESDGHRTATTGAERVVLDGIEIAGPEDVVEHMETVLFPRRARAIESFDPDDADHIAALIEGEREVQRRLGADILKAPYGGGFQDFPYFHYSTYGYVPYFSAYALYPEVMERDFAQQADLAALHNRAAARAVVEGGLPRIVRLDHDMADSRGTLVNETGLDRIWFPHFCRSIAPLIESDVRLLWHCDGNLMRMVPRLIEAGVSGFQGFQYEDGMDYARICRMRDRNGTPLFIIGGVSVTRTLPFGTPDDVRAELKWLVENGPPVGLLLGASSSITPGTPHANIRALIDGLAHYREHGR